MTLGSWRVLLLSALLLTLISFSPPFTAPWGISAVVVVITALTLGLAPHRFFVARQTHGRVVLRAYPPAELLIEVADGATLHLGDCFEIHAEHGQVKQGVVASQSFLDGRAGVRLYVPDLFELLQGSTPGELSIRPLATQVSSRLKPLVDALAIPGRHVVGITTEGSRMHQREVEVTALREVTLGELVWSVQGEARIYWQVTEARLAQTTWGGETRRQVVASAVQLGEWEEPKLAFVDRPVSPPVSEWCLVVRMSAQSKK